MRSRLVLAVGLCVIAAWTAAAQDGNAASAIKNPVKATPESMVAGKKLYDTQCATCHGTSGKGDGKMAASITGAKPADLTDATWEHGSTDADVYTVIHDGSKGTGMRGFASRMKTEDIWNVVNYLKTLAPSPPKSH